MSEFLAYASDISPTGRTVGEIFSTADQRFKNDLWQEIVFYNAFFEYDWTEYHFYYYYTSQSGSQLLSNVADAFEYETGIEWFLDTAGETNSRNVGIDVIFGISGVYSDGGNPAPIGRCQLNRGYALGGKSLYDLPNSYYDELVQHESTHYWEVDDHEGDHVMDNDGLNGVFGGQSNWIHNDITFLLYYDTQWFNIPPVV